MLGQQFESALREPVRDRVLTRGGEETAVHALGLHSEHQHRVETGQFCIDVVRDPHRPAGHADGQQGRWCDQHDLGSELGQQDRVGARHPAVQDVADDRHSTACDVPQPLTQRQGVEQGLGRVFVSAVTGVDHRRSAARNGFRGTTVDAGALIRGPVSDLVCGTGGGVPDDERIGTGGAQRHRGVAE